MPIPPDIAPPDMADPVDPVDMALLPDIPPPPLLLMFIAIGLFLF
jgi:hypothetical protein